MKFDPLSSWLPLRAKAENADVPLHRDLLSRVADHMEAEINGRIEPLMATLCDHPIYHFWRVGPENMVLDGYDAVFGFYSDMFANERQHFQVVCERIFVDDNGVITEGRVRQQYSADTLAAMGLNTVGGLDVTTSDLWLSDAQLITVWPNAGDGKLLGEDIYFGEDAMATLTPLTDEN